MKIISLNHTSHDFEVFHITDEFAKWCIDHNVSDEEAEEPECFNNFMTDFFRDLGYDNPEFKTFCVCEDDEPIRVLKMYPVEYIVEIIE
jgi:hypothetical protein